MKFSSSLITLALASVSMANPVARDTSGYVKASGQGFTLNGEPYTAFGSNSYWVGLMELSTTDMDTTFADIAATGGTTVRTWGFNEVTYPSGDYYQLWNGSTPTINYGATGLENFDNVVAAAKKYNIRLIVTLTNNWDNYGGMDVYVNQIIGQGQPHDYFYTNPEVIAAYQNYVKVFVSRYVNEPTIFGWELANEPRCTGSTNATSGTCTTTTITNWIKTISAYIKSIDTNHLVGLGDEGWFNYPGNPDESYNGSQGIDFNANLAVDTIDFGTFHLYPFSWSETNDPSAMVWGAEWIQNHRISQETYNKPVLMEEFGVLANQNQTETYLTWYSTVIDSGLTGVLIWQAGSNLTTGPSPNDGYAIYPDTPIYYMEEGFSRALKARNT
ncbi:glycoside hydrolase family 5 protein [Serpula lacrymans var. lacrymans S7.3]|uniref:mannan endo-1,4-beta-mannosidase n=2 Tax=Serpula lacrymans var. lacrymans TaxID=341189 RepID=F8PVM8_SERL3|nr:glycoside hydrolase family 5 protein [Serpula lacrymans var. lacrymans S7.9]EGN99845.1 glycoside hydrolase family 5 protein [Serpula lacrymans var. lacrymans S7.3]EGO25413.1 glycoside hydrolase family 5 protein [Serpula lacrymans var. lacrymans S7.9]